MTETLAPPKRTRRQKLREVAEEAQALLDADQPGRCKVTALRTGVRITIKKKQ